MCLAGQLFAENQTLALTGAGVVTGAYALVSRRGRLPALAGLAGCVLGALLMFGNPLYGQLAASGTAVSYTPLDVYKRQGSHRRPFGGTGTRTGA